MPVRQMRVTPPRAFLGSASAIGELQIQSEIGGFAEVEVPLQEGGSTTRKEFQRLDGATGDVSDAFYQFSVEHMAEWFGLDDAIYPHEIRLDGPHEKFFFPASQACLKVGLGRSTSARARFSIVANALWARGALWSMDDLLQISWPALCAQLMWTTSCASRSRARERRSMRR